MSETDIVSLIKETLAEHGKNMVSQSQCNGKLWGVVRWAVPLAISVLGGFAGMMLTLKLDVNTVKSKVEDLDRRIVLTETQFKVIDFKLDKLLGKKPQIQDVVK
jgi:hypothetical protein